MCTPANIVRTPCFTSGEPAIPVTAIKLLLGIFNHFDDFSFLTFSEKEK